MFRAVFFAAFLLAGVFAFRLKDLPGLQCFVFNFRNKFSSISIVKNPLWFRPCLVPFYMSVYLLNKKIPVENGKTLLESFPALRNTMSATSLIPWLRTHSTKRAPFIPPNFNGPQRYNYICLDQYQLF